VLPQNEAECFMINTLHDAINSMEPAQVRAALEGMSKDLLQQPVAHYRLENCEFGTSDCRYVIDPIVLKPTYQRHEIENIYAIPLVLRNYNEISTSIEYQIIYSYTSYGRTYEELIPEMLNNKEYIQLITDTKAIIDLLVASGASLEHGVPIINVTRELERLGGGDYDRSHEEDIYTTETPFQFCMSNTMYPIALHLLKIGHEMTTSILYDYLISMHNMIDHKHSYNFMSRVHSEEANALYKKFIRMYESKESITLPECSLPTDVVNTIYKAINR
jgi:hypothetical protein